MTLVQNVFNYSGVYFKKAIARKQVLKVFIKN